MTVAYEGHGVTVHIADALDVLAGMADASVDAVVTDPPYGLEFMGKEWDAPWKQGADVHAEARNRRAEEMGDENKRRYIASAVNKYAAGLPFQQWCEMWATECLRVLKPGGHLLAFGGTRTWHRLACAIEDSGFEVRDSIAWLYGSGFPKSLDVSKAIDRAAGAEREASGVRGNTQCGYLDRGEQCPGHDDAGQSMSGATVHRLPTAPATDAAREWEGWGTALKPAFEPVVVARKPLVGTVAQSVLTHGTGALNIDGCRISMSNEDRAIVNNRSGAGFGTGDTVGANQGRAAGKFTSAPAGRWPANVVLDDSQARLLDAESGERGGGVGQSTRGGGGGGDWNPTDRTEKPGQTVRGDGREIGYGDTGGASRFFPTFRYEAKAPATERPRVNGTAHPTVKPLDLMRWLVRLVTPPGGTVLEPFAGSGTTVEACIIEGFDCIAIEKGAEYLPLIMQRIHRRRDPVAAIRQTGDELGLFDHLEGAP